MTANEANPSYYRLVIYDYLDKAYQENLELLRHNYPFVYWSDQKEEISIIERIVIEQNDGEDLPKFYYSVFIHTARLNSLIKTLDRLKLKYKVVDNDIQRY